MAGRMMDMGPNLAHVGLAGSVSAAHDGLKAECGGTMGMDVIEAGFVFDTRSAPANERSASACHLLRTSGGTILATMRLGSDREGPDGHTAILASDDEGRTWQLRYLGLVDRDWDGRRGETRGWMLVELEPGVLTATVLYVDRLDGRAPWVDPETQGLLPMYTYHLVSDDGGRSWSRPRRLDLDAWPGPSPTGPILRVRDGTLLQPFEHWKARDDASVGRPSAMMIGSGDGIAWSEQIVVARHPDNALYYYDQRLVAQPDTGDLVAMFWTHEQAVGRDADVHIAWAPPDGRSWSVPVPTGLPGQHCSPISLGGDRLLAVYTHRGEPPGIRACLSGDFGRTWDRSSEIEVWSAEAGLDRGVGESRSPGDYWNDMGAWQFGHPVGVALPDGDVLVMFYGGTGATRPARWARISVDGA